jgi:hypothetical protein
MKKENQMVDWILDLKAVELDKMTVDNIVGRKVEMKIV